MLNTKYVVGRRSRLRKRTKDIKRSLRKSGIKTIQGVLNTSLLSDHSKINYIRHRFTCYNNFLKDFYATDEGIALRKELNRFIEGVVAKKINPSELVYYNEQLKAKLKSARRGVFTVTEPESNASKKLDFSQLPEIPGLNERGLAYLKTIPVDYRINQLTEENKVEICLEYISHHKLTWKKLLQERLQAKDLNAYLIETYLENRDKHFYPSDYSDLDYIKWKKLFSEAKLWLYHKLGDDHDGVRHFMEDILPKWIENNAEGFESKVLN